MKALIIIYWLISFALLSGCYEANLLAALIVVVNFGLASLLLTKKIRHHAK